MSNISRIKEEKVLDFPGKEPFYDLLAELKQGHDDESITDIAIVCKRGVDSDLEWYWRGSQIIVLGSLAKLRRIVEDFEGEDEE